MPYNSLRTDSVNLSNVLPTPVMPKIIDPTAGVRAQADAREQREAEQSRQRQDKALEQMLKDPRNAEYYSRTSGVPITPELKALLADPEKSQRLAEANAIADKMGVKSYEAKRTFAQKYLETGNMVEAGAAIEGMDTRAPMSPYQEEMVGVARERNDITRNHYATGGGGRPVNIPPTFSTNVEQMLDKMRGVKYTDHEKTMLLPGSAAPLSPDVTMQIANRAAILTQQSRNPVAAIQQAFQEIGGEGALEDADESPFAYSKVGSSGEYRPDRASGRAKYKRIRQAPAEPTSIPLPASPDTFAPAPFMESGVPAGLNDLVTQERARSQGAMPPQSDQYKQDMQTLGMTEGSSSGGGMPANQPRGVTGWKTGESSPPLRERPAPVRVSSPEEAAALPKGTVFVTPDGEIRTKR